MKLTLIFAVVFAFLVPSVYAGIPNPSNPPSQNYGQGLGNGATYSNYPEALIPTTHQAQNAVSGNTLTQGASDILWLFTGSNDSLHQQMRKGFRTNSQSTFFGRLWDIFKYTAYTRAVSPVEYKLGYLVDGTTNKVASSITGIGASRGQAVEQCYDCMQQQSTNPFAQNPNSTAEIFGQVTGAVGGVVGR